MLEGIKNLFTTFSPLPTILASYEMKKVGQINNIHIYARFSSPEWQEMSDHCHSNKVYLDGRPDVPVFSFMPNCHSINFTLKVDNMNKKSIGTRHIIDLGSDPEMAIKNFVENELLAMIDKKTAKYNSYFNS